MVKRFTIIGTSETTLSVSEIWPDGDAPENPTAQDVLDVVREYDPDGSGRIFSEWNLSVRWDVDEC